MICAYVNICLQNGYQEIKWPETWLTILPGGGGTPILSHIRDVRPEWVSFSGHKPADGCKFLTKNLRMGHKFDIILPGNG